jgi:hypothetical protein
MPWPVVDSVGERSRSSQGPREPLVSTLHELTAVSDPRHGSNGPRVPLMDVWNVLTVVGNRQQ